MSGLSAPILIKSFLFSRASDNMPLGQGGGRYCAAREKRAGVILSLLLEFADVIKSHPRPLAISLVTAYK